jgi:DnaJ like chaperone protein
LNWYGKLGGGILGFLAGRWIGAAIGVLLGHQFDRGLGSGKESPKSRRRRSRFSSEARQQIFFETTFLTMGHLAKADGRVSEQEIQVARQVMHRLNLRPEEVKRAIALFRAGKESSNTIEQKLAEFRSAFQRRPELTRAFLEIQMEIIVSKRSVAPAERKALWQIAHVLGVGRVELTQLEAIFRAQRTFGAGQYAKQPHNALAEAYKALGIEANATEREIKTAYRRLMNQHHPDKLQAKGLPDSMMEAAKERTREIRAAYEKVKEHRNIK